MCLFVGAFLFVLGQFGFVGPHWMAPLGPVKQRLEWADRQTDAHTSTCAPPIFQAEEALLLSDQLTLRFLSLSLSLSL